MIQLIALVLVIAAVYAIKAFAIMRQHDELALNSTSFSWASAREQDAEEAQAWTIEEAEDQSAHLAMHHLRRMGGASA